MAFRTLSAYSRPSRSRIAQFSLSTRVIAYYSLVLGRSLWQNPSPVADTPENRLLAGRYQFVSKLGQGGMGSVWRANDLHLRIEVAIKIIDAEIATSEEAWARFQREALAAAQLRSTHIVHITDHGIDGDTPFIAMELLEGESLASRLRRQRTLSLAETANVLAQVARALTVAHGKGIVHRDLKPDNVFIVREGDIEIVKVLDFGIAKR